MSGLIWIQTVWHSDSVPEDLKKKKKKIEKNQQTPKKNPEKLPSMQIVNLNLRTAFSDPYLLTCMPQPLPVHSCKAIVSLSTIW